MKPAHKEMVAYSVRHAARFLLFHVFTTVATLFLLQDVLLAPRAEALSGTRRIVPIRVRRCWHAHLVFCLSHLFLGCASCVVALGIVRPPDPAMTSSDRASQLLDRLRALISSWLADAVMTPVMTALLFSLLCLPLLPASWLGGLALSAGLFLWLALDARCVLCLDMGDVRSRATGGSSSMNVLSALAFPRTQRYAAIMVGQGTAAVLMAFAFYLTLRVTTQKFPTKPATSTEGHNATVAVTGATTMNHLLGSPTRTDLSSLHWMAAALGVIATAALALVGRCAGAGRHGPSRRRAESLQSPLMSSTDAFRSFAAKSSQRPSMQATLLLAASLRFSEVISSGAFLWFLLSCGPKRVDGLVVAVLFLCSSGFPAMSGWAVEWADVRSALTKRLVLTLLLARTLLGAALFVAQFTLQGEAVLDRFTMSTTVAPAAPPTSQVASAAPRTRLATVTALLLLDRGAVTMLAQWLPRVWEDVIREDKVLFNRTTSMTAATARLAWAVVQPFQALALVVLSVVVLALAPARLGDGAHLADPNADVRRALCVVVAVTEVTVAGALAAVWGRVYNITGRHLQFVELGTYATAESNETV